MVTCEEVVGFFDSSCTVVTTVRGEDVVTGEEVVGFFDSSFTFATTVPGEDVATGDEVVGFVDTMCTSSPENGAAGEAATAA